MNNKIMCVIIVIIISIIIVIYNIFANKSEEYIYENIIENVEENTSISEKVVEEKNIEIEKIKIYVTGEVNNPGVIEINKGDRINDAIEKAGGITANAVLDKVNLAYELQDGQKLYIPNNSEKDIEYISTENGEKVIEETISSKSQNKININKATAEELQNVRGIGPAMAEKIVDYREENGKFKNIEDLKNISGIGEKKYESIKEYITIK